MKISPCMAERGKTFHECLKSRDEAELGTPPRTSLALYWLARPAWRSGTLTSHVPLQVNARRCDEATLNASVDRLPPQSLHDDGVSLRLLAIIILPDTASSMCDVVGVMYDVRDIISWTCGSDSRAMSTSSARVRTSRHQVHQDDDGDAEEPRCMLLRCVCTCASNVGRDRRVESQGYGRGRRYANTFPTAFSLEILKETFLVDAYLLLLCSYTPICPIGSPRRCILPPPSHSNIGIILLIL